MHKICSQNEKVLYGFSNKLVDFQHIQERKDDLALKNGMIPTGVKVVKEPEMLHMPNRFGFLNDSDIVRL
jgi:hypothetical protein